MILFSRRTIAATLLGAAFLWGAVPAPSRAEGIETQAADFVKSLADQAINSLAVPDIGKPERVRRFRALFREHFAVRGIGKWILGRHWKDATEAEQTEYLKLFEDLMVVSYVDRFAEYAGESLNITKTIAQDDANATVYSEIVLPQGSQPVRVDWRVATKDGAAKVVDVMVEGTSMSATLRSDFGSIIRQRGGTMAGLLDALREKTAMLQKDMSGS